MPFQRAFVSISGCNEIRAQKPNLAGELKRVFTLKLADAAVPAMDLHFLPPKNHLRCATTALYSASLSTVLSVIVAVQAATMVRSRICLFRWSFLSPD